MGNQLVGIAPSQIHPVEYYLTDLPQIHYESSLGSTRFFKVARAKSEGGLIVVKVFAIQDPTLPLQVHKTHLEEIRNKLGPVFNCIPFQKVIITDKAGLLIREYVKYSLYDRISTRPFLTTIEKRWITFQILYGLHQCHKVGVCHGDLKLENICVTSWNWILLVDFASFKPTFLPEDNPADYSYFFDTSRRRTCYIAPERFVKGISCDFLSPTAFFGENGCKFDELTPAMDIFSLGCSLLELWNEGHVPFDLSQLLGYCSGEYDCTKHLDSLGDINLRKMVMSMLNKNPADRLSAEDYLNMERGRLFPEYFYNFLQSYMLIFSHNPILSPDEKILRLKKDVTNIVNILNDDGLVIIVTLVTSCIRGLHHSKLESLEIMFELAKYVNSDVILDRLIPYILLLCHDQWSRVRANAIFTLTECLNLVNQVPRSDNNIFPEYILPELVILSTDLNPYVRCVLAQNITKLADISLNYDKSNLRILRDMFQLIIINLLTDNETIVKQALMESIHKLCLFFGKQKANDIILSHMITFLNDNNDTELRLSFFDNIVGVASYIGYESSFILTPLLSQGVTDHSEFVSGKCINAMAELAELGLLKSEILCELVKETITFGLVHPSIWIRLATAGLISKSAIVLGQLDTQIKLIPLINDYLIYPLIQIEKPELLLNGLVTPIPRVIIDCVIKYPEILNILQQRQLSRIAIKSGNPPGLYYIEIPLNLKNLFQRLISEGMTELVEEQLLKMKNHLIKINNYKKNKINNNGKIIINNLIKSHKIDLNISKRHNNKNEKIQMNSEWQNMFGLNDQIELPETEIPEIIIHDTIQYRIPECRLQLRNLESLRMSRYIKSIQNRENAIRINWKAPIPAPDWKIRGISVAHLHEHRASVTRILPLGVLKSTAGLFISSGLDGCIRLWDCKRMEGGRNIANRSKQVYQTSTGGIIGVCGCESGETVCLVGCDGSLSTLRLERTVGVNAVTNIFNSAGGMEMVGACCDVVSIDNTVIACITTSGELIAFDLREPNPVWKLKYDLKQGVPTAMCVDNIRQSWLAVATNKGFHTAWDLRFRLPIAEIHHPANVQGGRVRRISSHPSEHSWIISSIQGNNEISMWNLESADRELVLWASSSPPLTYSNEQPSSPHYVLGLRPGLADRVPFLLAAGTDCRVRYWNLDASHESYIAVPSPKDTCAPIYKSRIIDGTTVIQELWSTEPHKSINSGGGGGGTSDDEKGRPGPELPSPGHRSPITDVALCHAGQCFLICGSTDGLITVWR